jgi:hypothetical protein
LRGVRHHVFSHVKLLSCRENSATHSATTAFSAGTLPEMAINFKTKNSLMSLFLTFMLLFSLIMRIFPAKKPNFYFGYQLGNAKKSIDHWKIANRLAANYMIILYSITLLVSTIFDYNEYDGGMLLLGIFLAGAIPMYWIIEKRLKRIDNATSDNTR